MELLKLLRIQWDRALAIGCVLGGLVVLVLGYRGASDTPHVAVQIPYFISGGVLGLFLLGVGGTLWLSADLRDEWRELRRTRVLLEAMHRATASLEDAPDDGADAAPVLVSIPPAASRPLRTGQRRGAGDSRTGT